MASEDVVGRAALALGDAGGPAQGRPQVGLLRREGVEPGCLHGAMEAGDVTVAEALEELRRRGCRRSSSRSSIWWT
jgi:hypothetical protein